MEMLSALPLPARVCVKSDNLKTYFIGYLSIGKDAVSIAPHTSSVTAMWAKAHVLVTKRVPHELADCDFEWKV
jgi:hypothetical protein